MMDDQFHRRNVPPISYPTLELGKSRLRGSSSCCCSLAWFGAASTSLRPIDVHFPNEVGACCCHAGSRRLHPTAVEVASGRSTMPDVVATKCRALRGEARHFERGVGRPVSDSNCLRRRDDPSIRSIHSSPQTMHEVMLGQTSLTSRCPALWSSSSYWTDPNGDGPHGQGSRTQSRSKKKLRHDDYSDSAASPPSPGGEHRTGECPPAPRRCCLPFLSSERSFRLQQQERHCDPKCLVGGTTERTKRETISCWRRTSSLTSTAELSVK